MITIRYFFVVLLLSFGFIIAGSGMVMAVADTNTAAERAIDETIGQEVENEFVLESIAIAMSQGGPNPLAQANPPGQTETPASKTSKENEKESNPPGQQSANETPSKAKNQSTNGGSESDTSSPSDGDNESTTGDSSTGTETSPNDSSTDTETRPNDSSTGTETGPDHSSTDSSDDRSSGQGNDSTGPPETGNNGSANDTNPSANQGDSNVSGEGTNSTNVGGSPETPKEENSSVGNVSGPQGHTGNTTDSGPPEWVDSPGAPGENTSTDPPEVPPGRPNGTSHSISVGNENVTVTVSQGPPEGTPGSRVGAHVANAPPNASIPVDLPNQAGNASVRTDQLRITVTQRQNVSLGVTTRENRNVNRTPEFAPSTAAEGIGYISVDHTVPDKEIDTVSVRFAVDSERISPGERENIALYRHHNGSWTELSTTYVNRNGTAYVFEATAPGLSEFTVGKKVATFEIKQATLEAEAQTTADPVAVRVRITNTGGADGVYTAKLLLDQEERASERLSIASGGTRQTSFQETVNEPGEYTVLVNNYTVGTLEVEPVAQPTTQAGTQDLMSETGADKSPVEGSAAETNADDEGASTTNIEMPGFGVGLALVSLIVTVLFGRQGFR